MKNPSTRTVLRRHILAIFGATAFCTLIPAILYGTLIVWSRDSGGPLNLLLIPATGAVVGLTLSLVIFLPVSLVAEKTSARNWLLGVGALVVVLAAPVILAWMSVRTLKPQYRLYLVMGSVSVYVVAAFFVYLASLALSSRIWPRFQ
jgi:hypothetical protein